MGRTYDEDGRSEPAKKFVCTHPGGNADGRRGRSNWRWCDDLEENVVLFGAETEELMCSQERCGGRLLGWSQPGK